MWPPRYQEGVPWEKWPLQIWRQNFGAKNFGAKKILMTWHFREVMTWHFREVMTWHAVARQRVCKIFSLATTWWRGTSQKWWRGMTLLLGKQLRTSVEWFGGTPRRASFSQKFGKVWKCHVIKLLVLTRVKTSLQKVVPALFRASEPLHGGPKILA